MCIVSFILLLYIKMSKLGRRGSKPVAPGDRTDPWKLSSVFKLAAPGPPISWSEFYDRRAKESHSGSSLGEWWIQHLRRSRQGFRDTWGDLYWVSLWNQWEVGTEAKDEPLLHLSNCSFCCVLVLFWVFKDGCFRYSIKPGSIIYPLSPQSIHFSPWFLFV